MGGLTEEEEMAEKIGVEERKLLIAQRKLESIRVLDELLERVKANSKPKDIKKDGRKKASENLTAKEKEIREKLVLKLKNKAEGDLSKQKIKVNRAKNDDFESVSDDDLSDEIDVSNDEMEDISEEDLKNEKSDSDDDKSSEIDSDEELRLTSTDEDSDEDKPRRKKEKKDKKKKGKEREKDRQSRKQREIDRQVRLA